ncbi:MAG TPA: carbohydrate-binding protein, partial [Actinocrinis sp.]|uniref:carbohydrate-binding protein n=1 Tax=Actinocrinis sp. TaxID=1920516 RepID=UPI002DDD4CBD
MLDLGTRSRRIVAASTAVFTLIGLLLGMAFLFAAQSASAAGTTYEAENAALSGGAVVATDHSGYTGTGFVAGYTDTNKGTADTTFTINAPNAGTYTLTLRYSNGTGSTMTLSLYTNSSKLKQITLPGTADWNTWTTETENVTLNTGNNTVAYKFDTTDTGNVNLDNLTVT